MRHRKGLTACLCLSLMLASGCQKLGGRLITVVFRDAEGVVGGERVLLSGVVIGETTAPTVQGGRAHVPVRIYRSHREAVPAGTVFLLRAESEFVGRKCLVGYSIGAGDPPPLPEVDIYKGASSLVELVAIIGVERATKIWFPGP